MALSEDNIALTNSNGMVMAIDRIPTEDFPAWLKSNRDYFNWLASYPEIEMAHLITDQSIIDEILAEAPQYDSLSLLEIKDHIETTYGNYDTYTYDYYISLYYNNNALQFEMVEVFDVSRCCYSVPMLRSLVEINGLDDLSMIDFAEVNLKSGTTIIMRIAVTGTTYRYYNYSKKPQ